MRRGKWEGLEHQPRHWGGEPLKFLERREELETVPQESQPGSIGRLGGQPGKRV